MIGNRDTCRERVPVWLTLVVIGGLTLPTHAQDTAASLSSSFREAAARAQKSLVSIRVPGGSAAPIPFIEPGPFHLPPEPFPSGAGRGRATFTGLVIDADQGLILTSNAMVQNVPRLIVTFADGQERRTTEIRRDPRSGFCLLVVDPKDLHLVSARWGKTSALEPGDWLVALGQPGDGDPTMSVGIFSARRRLGGEEFIETDAAIDRVGPGGILINLDGQVVGLCRPRAGRINGRWMEYALTSDRVRRVADELARFGQVRRGHLGITVVPAGSFLPGGPGPRDGVRIETVGVGSPAEEAGLRPGDVILAVDHRAVNTVMELRNAVESAPVGTRLMLEIERHGELAEIPVTIRSMAESAPSTRRPHIESKPEHRPDPDPAPREPSPPKPPESPSESPRF